MGYNLDDKISRQIYDLADEFRDDTIKSTAITAIPINIEDDVNKYCLKKRATSSLVGALVGTMLTMGGLYGTDHLKLNGGDDNTATDSQTTTSYETRIRELKGELKQCNSDLDKANSRYATLLNTQNNSSSDSKYSRNTLFQYSTGNSSVIVDTEGTIRMCADKNGNTDGYTLKIRGNVDSTLDILSNDTNNPAYIFYNIINKDLEKLKGN